MLNIKLKTKIFEKFRFQVDFSEVVGMDESLVSRVLHGRRELPRDKRKEWAHVLGIPMRELNTLLKNKEKTD